MNSTHKPFACAIPAGTTGGDGEFWLHELQDFAMNELQ